MALVISPRGFVLVVIGAVPLAFPPLIDRIRLQPVIRNRRQKTRESLLVTEEFMFAPLWIMDVCARCFRVAIDRSLLNAYCSLLTAH
jgi:hypothetical protein